MHKVPSDIPFFVPPRKQTVIRKILSRLLKSISYKRKIRKLKWALKCLIIYVINMIAETIARTDNPRMGLTLKVEVADLDFPRTSEQMSEVLTKHALECRHCLAAVLFCDETLAETGCARYKELLAKMRSLLEVHASIEVGDHIDEDILEEYCFNRLSAAQSGKLEAHLKTCEMCTHNLQGRREFIQYMKAALQLQQTGESAEGITGVIGVHFPDLQMSICTNAHQ